MAWPEMCEMLWFGGNWWWFPGRRISANSEFEWRDHRVYLLEPNGTVVEGILFVGEVTVD